MNIIISLYLAVWFSEVWTTFVVAPAKGFFLKPFSESFKLAQVRNQLVKNIKDLETKAMLPEMINALTRFLDFVRKENLDEAQLLADYTDQFIKSQL